MKNTIDKSKMKKSVLSVLAVMAFSFVLLLLSSFSTSPLYNTFGNDGLEYKLAGSAILDGFVMFRDIFHQKGALFLFVQAIGEALCRLFNDEKIGTFIIQYINICAVIFVIIKTEKLFFSNKSDKKSKAVKIVIFLITLFFFMSTFHLGNQIEEFALLFELIGLYIGVLYCKSVTDNVSFKPTLLFAVGICFAVAFWYKPTTAVSIGACAVFIGLHMLFNRRTADFFKSVLFGVLGIAVVTLPLLMYYYSKGALYDLLDQCFAFNIGYIESFKTAEMSLKQRLRNAVLIYGVPIATLIVAVLSRFNIISVFALTLSAFNLLMLLLTSTICIFYFTPETVVILALLLALSKIDSKALKSFCLVGLLLFSLGFFAYELLNTYNSYEKSNIAYWQQTVSDVRSFKNETKDIFSSDDKNNILYVENKDFVDNESRYFYYHMRNYPFTAKFCISFLTFENAEDYINSFYDKLENSPPKYIVIKNEFKDGNESNRGIIEKAKKDYSVVFVNEVYTLYQIK